MSWFDEPGSALLGSSSSLEPGTVIEFETNGFDYGDALEISFPDDGLRNDEGVISATQVKSAFPQENFLKPNGVTGRPDRRL